MRIERDEKVSDMMEKQMQNSELPVKASLETTQKTAALEHKQTGFIAVSIGEGMNEIFRSLGVDYIIEGGQTMNPSTEDMLNAIDNVNAEQLFFISRTTKILFLQQIRQNS